MTKESKKMRCPYACCNYVGPATVCPVCRVKRGRYIPTVYVTSSRDELTPPEPVQVKDNRGFGW